MIIRRRTPIGQRGDAPAQQVAQDGFTASVPTAQGGLQDAPAAQPSAPQPAMYVRCRVLQIEENADGTATVVRCVDPLAEDIDIQFEAGVKAVTAIAPKAFEGMTALRRVILPGTLRMIGEMAFTGCTGLESVVIPGSVVKVGTLAFAKCTSLRRVRIEPGVHTLGPSCFSKCLRLERVDVPASVQAFGGGVFFGCPKALTLHGGAGTMAEKYAKFNAVGYDTESFREDAQLVLEEAEDGTLTVLAPRDPQCRMIEIPSELCGRRLARIAPKAFFASSTLETLIIGSGVETIGENAFFGCRRLTLLSLERGLERIGEGAFAGCDALTQVMLPLGTGSVGRMAFFGCSSLSFVKMPPTTKVEDMAFDGCSAQLRVFGGVNAGRMANNTGVV